MVALHAAGFDASNVAPSSSCLVVCLMNKVGVVEVAKEYCALLIFSRCCMIKLCNTVKLNSHNVISLV